MWLASLLLALLAAPHGGPPVYMQASVKGERLELVLSGEQLSLGEWFGVPGRSELPLSEERRAALLAGAREDLAGLLELSVDGQTLELRVLGLKAFAPEAGSFGKEPSYELRVEAELSSDPLRMDCHWLRFPKPSAPKDPSAPPRELGDSSKERVTLAITSAEGVFDWVSLMRSEPSYTWHKPAAPVPIKLLPTGEPPAASGGLVRGFSAGALVLALCLAAGVLLGRATGAPGVRRSVHLAGCLAALMVGRSFSQAAPMPSPEQALELFGNLHSNMYRAFESSSRDEVYELLAASVDGPILDAMYGDIYEGLILREDGGAVAQVERVEVLEREFDPVLTAELGGSGFGVRWVWRVHGRVTHFAHEHQRLERIEARYSVRASKQGWRIAGVQVLSQEREL
ncbi:MAG: hypothetical protein ACI9HE_003807 [Planctomycetota bacterium]|jgi:hypothetical protein